MADATSHRAPIVLVHGLVGSLRDLVPCFTAIGVEAHAPDLLGYGQLRSVAPDRISLPSQVDHLVGWMDERELERAHVVGHSVGGATAMLLAHAHPSRVASVINVEGNFTLADAFWSGGLARMSHDEADAVIGGFRADPASWLARSGISARPEMLAVAARLLANQPASTIQATARSVVAVTGDPSYERALRDVFAGPAKVHLVSGERSRAGWNVPDWARSAAESEIILPGGHMMMVEHPDLFARSIPIGS